jgi:hypothetical protein
MTVVGPAPPAPVLAPEPELVLEAVELLAVELVAEVLVLALWHMPGMLFIELHVSPDGQPLPPLPRQPGWQVCEFGSQMRAELAPPQSASVAQPHVSFERHAAPVPDALQFCVWFVVHWTHVSVVESQTLPLGQSGSLRHCTQPCGWVMVLHTAFGGEQSVLLLQGSAMHVPTVPSILVQYWPVGQLVVPPMPPSAPTTRQPVVHTPVATLDVLQ